MIKDGSSFGSNGLRAKHVRHLPSALLWLIIGLAGVTEADISCVQLIPEWPDEGDSLSLQVQGLVPTPCWEVVDLEVDSGSNSISIGIYVLNDLPAGWSCIQVIWGYRTTVPLGHLPAGEYRLSLVEYRRASCCDPVDQWTSVDSTQIAFQVGSFTSTADDQLGEGNTEVIRDHRLLQNYPNPFNPVTDIEFGLPTSQHVRLTVLNIIGQTVEVLVDENMPAGNHTIRWDASGMATGAYFYRLEAGDFVETKKMLIMK